MRVLYQQGLEEMAAQLAGMGFAMYPISENRPADAVLYADSVHEAFGVKAGRHGTAILCVRGMDAVQTAQAIRRRCCMRLF